MKPAPDRQAGYTIIEVMIFLIISSALVLSAVGLFNGRIQRTQFTQAVQSFDTRLKTIANEASTGTSPEATFSCSSGSGEPVIDTSGTAKQGERSSCIFLGKIIAPASTCVATLAAKNCTAFDVYTIIGRRLDDNNQAVSKLVDTSGTVGAKPRVVLDPDITQTVNLGYDTRITGIFQGGAFPLRSGLGFLQSLNSTYNNGNLASGAQNIETWAVRSQVVSPASPLQRSDMATAVSTEKFFRPASSGDLWVCLKSSTGDQVASVTVDSINGTVSTTVKIGDTVKCS